MKVLIVDDSSLYRKILSNSVESIQGNIQVSTAPTGAIALKKIPDFSPDIVLLDIEMPEMNGIEVLKKIKESFPKLNVILVSGVNTRSADITIEGLSAGAADFIPKPTGTNLEQNTKELKTSLETAFKFFKGTEFYQRAPSEVSAAIASRPATEISHGTIPSIIPTRVDIVGIGISTGGPNALLQMIPELPLNLKAPIVIVQHMPPVFTTSLAKALNDKSKVSVVEAAEGMTLEPGNVYLAPGGIHTTVRKQSSGENGSFTFVLEDSPPVNSCKPAVDVLFKSIARTAGGKSLAVIMTGMGSDGLTGVMAIKEQMGYCLSQSAETCTVYGMPQAVDQANLSDEKIPLPLMASRITSISNGI